MKKRGPPTNDNTRTADIQAQALDLANIIGSAMSGYHAAAGHAALGMMIGYSASQAERPDLDGLMTIIGRVARDEFDRRTIGR